MRFARHIFLLSVGLSFANAQAPPTIDQALAQLGLSKDRASLYKDLHDSRAEIRSIAAAELVEMRDINAIPMILDAMAREPDKQTRFNMAQDLNSLGSPVGAHRLQSYCSDMHESFELRMQAANDLSITRNYDCLPFVSDILYSPEVGLRESVLLYLSHIPAPPPTFPSQLGAALLHVVQHDSDAYFRSLAAKTISQIGDQTTKAGYQQYLDSKK